MGILGQGFLGKVFRGVALAGAVAVSAVGIAGSAYAQAVSSSASDSDSSSKSEMKNNVLFAIAPDIGASVDGCTATEGVSGALGIPNVLAASLGATDGVWVVDCGRHGAAIAIMDAGGKLKNAVYVGAGVQSLAGQYEPIKVALTETTAIKDYLACRGMVDPTPDMLNRSQNVLTSPAFGTVYGLSDNVDNMKACKVFFRMLEEDVRAIKNGDEEKVSSVIMPITDPRANDIVERSSGIAALRQRVVDHVVAEEIKRIMPRLAA